MREIKFRAWDKEKKAMSIAFPEKLFVTGTDTGVGKTVISTILVSGLNASYWKPIQSGLREQTDTEFVKKFSSES